MILSKSGAQTAIRAPELPKEAGGVRRHSPPPVTVLTRDAGFWSEPPAKIAPALRLSRGTRAVSAFPWQVESAWRTTGQHGWFEGRATIPGPSFCAAELVVSHV